MGKGLCGRRNIPNPLLEIEMTTKLQNGNFSEQTFASPFGSDQRDRGSIIARRYARLQRRVSRAL